MVAYEVVNAFREAGHDVLVQSLLDVGRGSGLTEQERDDIEGMEKLGLAVLEPLWVQHWGGSDGRRAVLEQALRPRVAGFYPSLALAADVRRRADETQADL